MREKQQVLIFQPTKTAMQSGKANTRLWAIEFVETPEDREFIEPLMGWTSSRNTQKQVRLKFQSKEEAVAYAQRQGYGFQVIEPKPRKLIKKAYADNFKYVKPEA